ncbi:MAG: right-handed parallel beta-helix repeat-containing protein [Promethearchaeota archaeon]
MNKKSKIKLYSLFLGTIFAASILFLNNFNFISTYLKDISINNDNVIKNNDYLKISKISAPINIDANDPNSNWNIAKSAGICTGNGTVSDPYVIEDLIIDGASTSNCILIENSKVYFRIENCTVFNSGSYSTHAGIKLVRVGNATLLNNNISNNNANGIYLDHSDYNLISSNILNNNDDHGIYLYWSVENDILSNDASYNHRDGIFLEHSHLSQFSGNTVNYNHGNGINSPMYLDSNFNILTTNTVNNNWGTGIELSTSSYCTVSVNEVINNGNYGINMNGYDNLISGNNVNNNYYGIRLDRCYNSEVSKNTVNYNTNTGIMIFEGSNNRVSENDVINNDEYGISISGDDHSITGNIINFNEVGILVMDCFDIEIMGNGIRYSDLYGIHVTNSFAITITINSFIDNSVAVYIYKSDADLSNNVFNGNDVDVREIAEPSFPYAAVITGTLIVIGLLIGSLFIVRRKKFKARTKISSSDKLKEKFQVTEIPKVERALEDDSKLDLAIQEIKEEIPVQDELKVELSTEQLRSKYKYEIDKIREKVYNKNYFISLLGIDQILIQFEKFNLKERQESQDAYLELIFKYATRFCEIDNEVLISEIHIEKAVKELYRKDLMRTFSVSELEEQPAKVEILHEEEEVEQNEVAKDELGQILSIEQVRDRYDKYNREIEKIRDKFQSQNVFVNLKGVNEVINSIEKLNLKKREEILDDYLEKLLNYAIIFCKNGNENLVNESHIQMAFQEIYRTELDLIKKIQLSEEISAIRPEAQPSELQVEIMEEEKISVSEVLPLEEDVIEEKEIGVSAPVDQIEELPIEEQTPIVEEVIKIEHEEPPEEILPPEPQITYCPFCGFVFDETPNFCPQCGMIFKKK